VAEIDNYPALVDAIWKIVQGTPEERERVDFTFSEQQIAGELGITYKRDSDPCTFGIAQAFNDLVDLGYCKDRAIFIGEPSSWSPSPDCPDISPSTNFLVPPIARLPPFRLKALQFIHEQTLRHEEGITFYKAARFSVEDVVPILLPSIGETDMQASIAQVFEAMFGLEKRGFVSGPIKGGTFMLSVKLKGACWLLVSQPLLKLSERAKQLITHPEASESTALLINAYSEAPSHAAHKMYIVIEKLENAAGGERKLIELLGQPKAYIGDLKQSLQLHRHAETQARIKLNYQQCLERTTKIIEMYIVTTQVGLPRLIN
jgi:hypothetical protein